MKTSPAAARILVATDNADDSRQILRQLNATFEHVRTSTDAASAAADFAAFLPEVLVLAFDTLAKSQAHYLGLFRNDADAIPAPHRAVVLCSKDEARAAFELCRRDLFDDYVLYWPQSQDGNRLVMSVWIAARHAVPAAPRQAVAERVAEREPEPGPEPEPGRRPLVLIVDDDDFARRLAVQALDPACWEVALAADSAAAMALLQRRRPDVILMDVRLPGMDGVALTRHLKASPRLKDIPVVMMTGDARRETLSSSLEAGAAGFVVKPVTRAGLEAGIRRALGRG